MPLERKPLGVRARRSVGLRVTGAWRSLTNAYGELVGFGVAAGVLKRADFDQALFLEMPILSINSLRNNAFDAGMALQLLAQKISALSQIVGRQMEEQLIKDAG